MATPKFKKGDKAKPCKQSSQERLNELVQQRLSTLLEFFTNP